MTNIARRVLADCHTLLRQLESDPRGDDWRRLWILTVTLLRTVGYALKNADAVTDAALERIVDRRWRELSSSRPEPAIFWSFIEEERNNILKEYQINAGINATVRPGTNSYTLTTGSVRQIAPSEPTIYDYVINGGPFSGRDQREVVSEAIQWWEEYLTAIEQEHSARDA